MFNVFFSRFQFILILQVMTAASYWSLLAPAIEMAEQSGYYGSEGQWAFVPVAVGFALGALFVYSTDVLLPYLVRKVNRQIIIFVILVLK